MGTEILKSFGVLQSELEQAKSSLKGVDENIKRLIGRDPSEIVLRPGLKRGPTVEDSTRGRSRPVLNRNRNFNHENDEPPNKRRPNSVFKRLSERPVYYEDEVVQQPQKQLISKVIVTPREVPSRQEALAAQSGDAKSKERNRRMFGALLGTLQKFQQEETKLKSKEQKRAQVEKRIEEHEIREKAEIKKERQELFFNRKKKQAEIKMIELKMTRMKEYALWEERQKPRVNFIQTKAKPQISYLPRKLNDTNRALLETCKQDIEKMIEKRRQEVFTELQHIEERMKKNFESRRPKDATQDNHHDDKVDQPDDEDHENGVEDKLDHQDVKAENLNNEDKHDVTEESQILVQENMPTELINQPPEEEIDPHIKQNQSQEGESAFESTVDNATEESTSQSTNLNELDLKEELKQESLLHVQNVQEASD